MLNFIVLFFQKSMSPKEVHIPTYIINSYKKVEKNKTELIFIAL